MSTRRAPRIVVHIDRVALRGYAAHEREAIVESLRAQLTTRFAAESHALQSGGTRSVHALRATPTPGAGSTGAPGAGVADSIMSWIRA